METFRAINSGYVLFGRLVILKKSRTRKILFLIIGYDINSYLCVPVGGETLACLNWEYHASCATKYISTVEFEQVDFFVKVFQR